MIRSLRSKSSLVVACLSLLALSAVASYAVTVPDGNFENCTLGEQIDGSNGKVWYSDNAWIFGATNTGSATIVSGGVDGSKCTKFERTSLSSDTVMYTSPYPWCNPVVATPGQTYTVSFWAYGTGVLNFQAVSWNSPDPTHYVLNCNGNELLVDCNEYWQTYTMTDQWTKYTSTFTAKAGTQVEALSFRNNSIGTFYLDNITMTAVPEPGSIVAMLSGLAGLVGFGIRKRK